MEKIVIISGPEGPDSNLISWICAVFPECEIEIKQKASGRKPIQAVSSRDGAVPHGKVLREPRHRTPDKNLIDR